MYEGIKVLNSGQNIDLGSLQKNANGEHILSGITSLKIYVENGALYNENIQIMENNNDVKISLTDSEGNEVFIILRGLGELLLTNNTDVPIFEVFQGLGGEKLAFMTTIDDLEAAAAGGETLSVDQSGNPEGAAALSATDSDAISSRLAGLGSPFPGDPNTPTFAYDVTFNGDSVGEAIEDNSDASGLLTNSDPHYGTQLYIPTTVVGIYGTFSIDENGNWFYDLDHDNPAVQSLADTETLSEVFNAKVVDLPFSQDINISILGTNDQPIIEDIIIENIKGEIVDLYDDGSYIIAWTDYNQEDYPEGGSILFDEGPESTLSIYAQKYDSEGKKIGDEILVETMDSYNISFYHDTFSVIALADGGFTVNWRTYDYSEEDSGYGLHYQRYDVDGNPSHAQVIIDELDEEGYQRMSKAQFDELNDGSISIAWKEFSDNEQDNSQLVVQRVGTDGNLIGEPIVIAQEGYFENLEVQDIKRFEIEPNGDSGFKVVWFQYVQESFADGEESPTIRDYDSNYYQLMYAEFDNDGNQVGNTIEVSRNNNWFNDPEITSLLGAIEGQNVISWLGQDEDNSDYGFYIQLTSSSGLEGDPILLLDQYNRQINGTPDVAALDGGGFVVTWNEYSYEYDENAPKLKGMDGDWIVYSQMFDSDGESVSEPIVVFDNSVYMGTAVHYSPSVFDVRGTEDGGFTIAWFNESYMQGPRMFSDGDESMQDDGFYYYMFDSEGNLTYSKEPTIHYESLDGTNIITGELTVTDVDTSNTHEFRVFGDIEVTHEELSENDGPMPSIVSLDIGPGSLDGEEEPLPTPEVFVTMALNAETGEWEYKIEGDFNYLAYGESATITFQYVADDLRGFDGTDGVHESSISEPKTISVTIVGTNDQPVIQTVINDGEAVIETSMKNTIDEPINTITGTLTALDDDIHDNHHFRLSYIDDGQEFLAQEADYSKDYQYVQYHRYADQHNGTDETRIVVESNDVDADDIDIQDIRLLTNDRQDSEVTFELDGDFKALGVGETATVTFEVLAGDGRGFSSATEYNETTRSEPEYVTITIEGTNDQPVVLNINANVLSESKSWGFDDGVPDDLSVSGATTNHQNYGGSWSSGSDLVLNFVESGTRSIVLEDQDTSSGGTFSFDFIYGNSSNGGENVDYGEEVVFEYSLDNGNTWIRHTEFDLGTYQNGNWHNISFDLIGDLSNSDIDFRLLQKSHSGSCCDHWAINNLEIGSSVASRIFETHDDQDYQNGQDDTQDDVYTLFEGTLKVQDDDVNDTHKFYLDQGSVSVTNMPTETILLGQKGDGELGLINWGAKVDNHTRVMELENGMTVTTSSDSSRLKQYDENKNHIGQGIADKDGNGIQSGESIIVTFDGGQVNSATFGFDGLGNHFREDSSQKAKATWTAFNNGVEVASGAIDSETLFLEVGTGVNFDEVVFSTDSTVGSNWELRYVEAEVMPIEIVVDENGEYDVEGNFNYLAAGETATVTFDYYVEDNREITDPSDPNHELSRSELATVTLEITGTNDQPIVENIVLGVDDSETRRDETIYESHDQRDRDGVDDTNGESHADRRQEPLNVITGRLSASDDDLSDTHIFGIADMELDKKPDIRDVSGPSSELVNVDYDLHGRVGAPVEGQVDVLFKSDYVNARDIDIKKISFESNGGNDSEAIFKVKGDFSALGVGETATVTFKYYADDQILDKNGESNLSEYKTVSITVTGTNDQPIVDDIILGKGKNTIYEDTLIDYKDTEDSLFRGQLVEARDEDVNNINPHYRLVGAILVSDNLARIDANDVQVVLEDANNNGWSTSRNYGVFSDAFNTLGADETVTVTFQYKASDWEGYVETGDSKNEASHSEIKTVTLTITGTNDQPVVDDITLGDTLENIIYESSLLEHMQSEEALFTGQLTEARDEDVTNTNPHYKLVGDVTVSKNVVGIDENDVQVVLENAAGNGWSTSRDYGVFSEEFNSLGVDETVTVSFKYKASDWEGFGKFGDLHNEPSHSEVKVVTLTITGTNDQPEIEKVERIIAEEVSGANKIEGQLVAQDDDFTNVDKDEITFALVDFDYIVPSNSEVVYSVGGNTFKLLSDDVNVNNFTNKITSITVDADGKYIVEGDFTKLSTDEELTIIFQYQANDNEGILTGDLVHEESLSNIQTVELTIIGTNDIPILKNVVSSVDFTENDLPLIIDDTLKIKDFDDSHIEKAVITISGNYQDGYDFLNIDNGDLANNVTATLTNEVLTLTGHASKSDYEDMLEHITFVNTNEDPSNLPRTITWIINDGDNDSNPKTTTINVIPVNDAPVAFKNYNEVVEKGVGFPAAANLDGNIITQIDKNGKVDYDLDNPEDLEISGIKSQNNNNSFDTTFNHTINGEPALRIAGEYGILLVDKDGNYKYNLKDNWASTDSLEEGEIVKDKFIYKLSDGDKIDTSKLIITITGTNDAPDVTNDTYTNAVDDLLTTQEDTPLVIASATLLANDSDAEGDTLTITEVSSSDGTVSLDLFTGEITFIPNPNFSGEATFEYTVSDGNGGTSDGVVTVNITPEADTPLLDVTIVETYHPSVPATSDIVFDTAGANQNVFAYKSKGDAFTSSVLEVNSLQDTNATVSSNSGNGLGAAANNDSNANKAVVDGNELLVFDLGGAVDSANIVFKHAKGDNLFIRAYDINGNKIGSTVTTGLFANDADNSFLFNPSGSSLFSYITIHGTKINNQGKFGFNVKEIEVTDLNAQPEYYEYNLSLHGVSTDNSETLSDVTISGLPGVDQVVSLDANGDASITFNSSTSIDQDLVTANVTSSENSEPTEQATVEAIHNMLSVMDADSNLDFNNVLDSDLPKLESIDLSTGSHILSNINVDDVLSMTSDNIDSILKINGDDQNDEIYIDLNEWQVVAPDTIDSPNNTHSDGNTDGYVTYEGISNNTVQLLIDQDIDVKF